MKLPLTLDPGKRVVVRFAGDMGKIDLPPGETRDLHFYLTEIRLLPVKDKTL